MNTGGPLVVAVEGGGTKTVALAIDYRGEAVAWGRGGSSLALHVGEERAQEAVNHALAGVAGQVGPRQVTAAVIAMVGRGYSADPAASVRSRFPDARVQRMHEGDAALLGATLEAVGVVVISGTGSFARAVGAQGAVAQVGGNGPLVGDEGSAHYIAVEGIRRALWAVDGRGELTALSDRTREHFAVAELKDVAHRLYGPGAASRHDIASFAPVVLAAADEGDAVAGRVLDDAARHLAAMVLAAVAQVRRVGDGWAGLVPFGCSGGVLLADARLRAAVTDKVVAEEPDVDPREPRLPPIGGVALRALREAGVALDGQVVERMASTLPEAVGLAADPR